MPRQAPPPNLNVLYFISVFTHLTNLAENLKSCSLCKKYLPLTGRRNLLLPCRRCRSQVTAWQTEYVHSILVRARDVEQLREQLREQWNRLAPPRPTDRIHTRSAVEDDRTHYGDYRRTHRSAIFYEYCMYMAAGRSSIQTTAPSPTQQSLQVPPPRPLETHDSGPTAAARPSDHPRVEDPALASSLEIASRAPGSGRPLGTSAPPHS